MDGCSNFSSWNFIMKMSLGLDLWDCIRSENKSKLDLKKGQKDLTFICLNIKTHCQIHVRCCFRQAWDKLCKAYENKSLPRLLNLIRALIEIDYNDFNDINSYMCEAIEISYKLADIGNPIENKLLAVIILAGLYFSI